MKKAYKIASLFSGCGGMDLGAEGGFSYLGDNYKKLNTHTVYAMDFDEKIVEIYNNNFTNKCFVLDIRKVPSDTVPDHDILTGGFPCQSFSVVAQNPKRLGYKDEKGQLFFEMKRILGDKKPKAFIAENVKGILSANQGEAFPLIIKEFESVGYFIKHKVLNAVNYGVPQKRERVFIVGFRNKDAYDRFRFPKVRNASDFVPLSKVVDDEKTIEEKYYFSKKAVAGLHSSKHKKTMNKGRSQKLSEPCNTVGAHLAKVSLNSTDPVLQVNGRYRMFTPREVARIQSFPENYQLTGSKTTNYKALGNAVPPVMMWYVTKSLIKALQKR